MSARGKDGPVRVADVLPGVLEDLGFEGARVGLRVVECWKEVVGPEMARHCQPVRVQGNLLEVSAGSGVWAQELRFRQEGILAGLQARLGEQAPAELFVRVG